MIKVKDGYGKLIGTTYQGSATQVLLSNGGNLEFSSGTKANTLVQRNANQHVYATYFNSAISDEALTDIGSVYVRNTSDTFIRRISKTQFYSIIDNKFVTLDTAQTITGVKTFSTSVRFANNASIIQNQSDTSNYTTILEWYKNGASRNTYDPSIGQHNTGGDGNGSICILPYPTATSPWNGTVGLFISKGVLKLDGKSIALAENYYTKTESDERYVTLTTNQTVSGIKTFSRQQKFTVATGTSPFTVSSTTVVSNLNADMLDGWHLSYILKDGYVTSDTAGLSSYWRKVWDITLNSQYNDVDINLLVHSAYNQQWGIISFRLRLNGTGTAKNIFAYLAEVVGNIPLDRFRLYYNNSSGLCQLWCNPSGQYNVYNYRVLAKTWRTGTEATTLGTFYTGNTTTAQSLPSDSYVSMTGITIVNTAAKVANTLTFSAGKFSSKTYNGSSAITVNVPTHTSHLTNDSGFWTGTRYWANIAVSTASNSGTSPTFSTAYTSNWFRSTGSTGWYSQTYGGGIYMTDTTYVRVYNDKRFYASGGYLAPYTGSSWISMATRSDCIVANQNNSTSSAHCLFRAKYNNGNALCFGGLGNDLGFYGFSATNISNGTNSYAWIAKWNSEGSFFNTGSITAAGGFYHSSVNSNSYVLLAGGSYKGLGDFAKGNAGSATKGVYVTGGTVTAMTYSLSANLNSGTAGKLATYSSGTTVEAYNSTVGASNRGIYMSSGVPTVMTYYLNSTVNSGTSGKLAYYSNATTIASYGSTIGNTARPVYINAGVPVMSQYSFTGTYSNPVVIWCGEIYRSSASSQYWYITKIGGCCSASLYDKYANDGNLVVYLSDGTPYAAICNTIRFWDGGTARSAGDGTIRGQSAGMGDYMTICTSDGKIYIRKFSQQNKDNDSWTNGELGITTTSNGNKPVARFSLVVIGVHN